MSGDEWRSVSRAMVREALCRPVMPPGFVAAYLLGAWEARRFARRSPPPKTWPNGHPVTRLRQRSLRGHG